MNAKVPKSDVASLNIQNMLQQKAGFSENNDFGTFGYHSAYVRSIGVIDA